MRQSKKFNKKKVLENQKTVINKSLQEQCDEDREFLENFEFRTGIDFSTFMKNLVRINNDKK